MCDLLAIFNFHELANIMVFLIFCLSHICKRLQVFERFTDSANSFFSHVGIEHASVEFPILNAWFYYTYSKQKVLDTMYIYSFWRKHCESGLNYISVVNNSFQFSQKELNCKASLCYI